MTTPVQRPASNSESRKRAAEAEAEAADRGMVEIGPGDDFDLEAGRCCPTCRHLLTEHNRALWESGYAIGQRHMLGGAR